MARSSAAFTADEGCLRNAKFYIVAVPTPINQDHTPNLAPVIGASESDAKRERDVDLRPFAAAQDTDGSINRGGS